MELAVQRRLHQELGMSAELQFTYKFEYTARFGDLGSEHELCWVYVGQTDQQPVINVTEIERLALDRPGQFERRSARNARVLHPLADSRMATAQPGVRPSSAGFENPLTPFPSLARCMGCTNN